MKPDRMVPWGVTTRRGRYRYYALLFPRAVARRKAIADSVGGELPQRRGRRASY